jgi:sporulation protein YlmC with PRC-barrel domain
MDVAEQLVFSGYAKSGYFKMNEWRQQMQPETTMLETSKVPGTPVFGRAQEEIGEVDDLIVDTVTGKVRYAILSFGGFLGLGKSNYVIPWTSLKWDPNLNGYVTGVTEEQLKMSPDLDPLSLRDRELEQRLHAAYGAPNYWELEATRS